MNISLVAECDRGEFRNQCNPVDAVTWHDAIIWTIRQMVLDVAAITAIYKFPITAAFTNEGYVMPGWSHFKDEEKAAINWRWLQYAIIRFGDWSSSIYRGTEGSHRDIAGRGATCPEDPEVIVMAAAALSATCGIPASHGEMAAEADPFDG